MDYGGHFNLMNGTVGKPSSVGNPNVIAENVDSLWTQKHVMAFIIKQYHLNIDCLKLIF